MLTDLVGARPRRGGELADDARLVLEAGLAQEVERTAMFAYDQADQREVFDVIDVHRFEKPRPEKSKPVRLRLRHT